MGRRTNLIQRQHLSNEPAAKPVKVVVTGPFSAGKTTLIETISDVTIVGTEREVTDATRAVKTRTTVAMDFGRIMLPGRVSLHLFGTPGQRRFEAIWEILSEGMLGLVVLVHAARGESIVESGHILDTFRDYADVPYIVGVTHLDQLDENSGDVFERVRETLRLPSEISVLACDPRRKEDVKALLLGLLLLVRSRLEEEG